MPLLLPINLMEIIIRPLALCMRLFGNILGAFIIMETHQAHLPGGGACTLQHLL
ncbi:MAG: F0F1 ATP synthase subunit A [Oscillospiraceae bacterium]